MGNIIVSCYSIAYLHKESRLSIKYLLWFFIISYNYIILSDSTTVYFLSYIFVHID